MAQHDYNIANATFPNTRTDINGALGAIATNNSGDTQPSTMFANQWWYETDTNKLYIRNEDNDAWIHILTLNQTNDTVASLEGASSLAGIDDQSSSNDDQITITDSAVIINEDSDDLDFRIESNGNANMLFVDGGNNKVAIGSTSANGIFDVHGTVSAGGSTNQIIQRWRIGSDNVTAEMTYDDDGDNSGTFRGFNFGNVTQHDFMIKTHDSTSIHCHANGQVTMPKQPAVLALSTSAQNDIATGVVKINLDSEVYDVGGNFNTSTATFTAPRTGKYMCCGQITMSDVDTAFQWIYGRFNTSNRIYYMSVIDPRIEMSADGTHTYNKFCLMY